MSTNYPGSLDSYTAKADGVDYVLAAHVNNLQDAVVAIETELGTQPRHVTTTAPTVNDDTGDGYSVGTHWYDTTNDRHYVCIDATAGAAIWMEMPMSTVAWTPVVTQGASTPTLTITRARYQIHGKWLHIMANIIVTAAGSAGNAIVVSGWSAAFNPVDPGFAAAVGVGVVYDNGTAFYPAIVCIAGGDLTKVQFWWQPTGNVLGANPNFALANTDEIYLDCSWEIA